MSITENFQRIRNEVPEHVTIVLAAKTRTPEEVEEAILAGATDIGHNYVQEAEAMYPSLAKQYPQVRWHMIGHLQKNKINKALPVFDLFQTIDSFDKAEALDKRAAKAGKVYPVYIEVNIGEERAKAGMPPEYAALERLIHEMSALEHIRVEGLMTMGLFSEDPEDNRPYFRAAKEMFDNAANLDVPNVSMKTLSMGMSDSYQVAIEEGSNMIRLGTIVFGPRVYT